MGYLLIIYCLSILLVLSDSYLVHSSIKPSLNVQQLVGTRLFGFPPGWTVRKNYDIEDRSEQDLKNARFLIDYPIEAKRPASIGNLTMAEASRKYHFRLSYLADYAVSLGCSCPIDADTPMQNIMDADQLLHMMALVSTVDPSVLNQPYENSFSIRQLCEQWSVSYPEMIRLCDRCNVPLPFNLDSIPHEPNIQLLKRQLDSDRRLMSIGQEKEQQSQQRASSQHKPLPPPKPSTVIDPYNLDEFTEAEREEFQNRFRFLSSGNIRPVGDTSIFFDGPPRPDQVID